MIQYIMTTKETGTMAYQTNSFSIAHYILLIAMVVLCGGVVAYAIVHDTAGYEDAFGNRAPTDDTQQVQSPTNNECIQRISDIVAQTWAYNPDAVPEKYTNIAMAYLATPTRTTIRGECNGEQFVCNPGVRRMDCDPCAVGSARDYAIAAQTRDMAQKHCGE